MMGISEYSVTISDDEEIFLGSLDPLPDKLDEDTTRFVTHHMLTRTNANPI